MSNIMSAQVVQASASFFCCTCCLSDINNQTHVIIDSSPVCEECIRTSIIPMFHAALKYEINYPVRWSAKVVLQPQDFPSFLDDYADFSGKWGMKEREYKTLAKNRIYCQAKDKTNGERCNQFAGDRTAFLLGSVYCGSCFKCICTHCGQPGKHKCRPEGEEDELEALKKLAKLCPDCGMAIQLKDGCNHITCPCGAEFCYCCGLRNPEQSHCRHATPGA